MNDPPRHRARWNVLEEALMATEACDGKKPEDIAQAIGRTPSSVAIHMDALLERLMGTVPSPVNSVRYEEWRNMRHELRLLRQFRDPLQSWDDMVRLLPKVNRYYKQETQR